MQPNAKKQLIAMMGVSGAGKDRFVNDHVSGATTVASADDFFGNPYLYVPLQLGLAHGACFRKVIDALQNKEELVVVNNTNTSVLELAPYMAAAQAYDYEARIVCLQIDPKIAAARNKHGTPLAVVEKMAARIDNTLKMMPLRWNVSILVWDVKTSQYRES